MSARSRAVAWIKQRQHAPLVRAGLDGAQIAYEIARRFARGAARPAIEGGWPARLVPFPPPKPFTAVERRELARVADEQNTSFFDGGAVKRFERALREHFGVEHAIAVSSGTSALHAALFAIGVGPGDEVIVPALTYVSTALAVVHCGATPRFVDAHPTQWNLDPARVAEAIGPRTKAIVPVHLCGVPCEMDTLQALARKHGLRIVEDAAQAHGSLYRGKKVGTLGDIGCFSFQSAKTLSTGEGGAILTNDAELARRARLAMNVGETTRDGVPSLSASDIDPTTRWMYATRGWNHRISAVQAALGIAQLERSAAIFAAHRRNARALRERLVPLGLVPQDVPAGADPCFAALFVDVGSRDRDGLARALARERIDFRSPYSRPLPDEPVFAAPGSFPVARAVCNTTIGFRVDPSIRRREVEAVALALERLVARVPRTARQSIETGSTST